MGRQRAKILKDRGLPCFLDSGSQGFGGQHQCKHLASAPECKAYRYNDRRQWRCIVQVARFCTACFKHTMIISLAQIANQGIRWVDILQIYLLQFSRFGCFFKFCARVSYYCLAEVIWLEADWLHLTFARLCWVELNLWCCLPQFHNYCIDFINLIKLFWE